MRVGGPVDGSAPGWREASQSATSRLDDLTVLTVPQPTPTPPTQPHPASTSPQIATRQQLLQRPQRRDSRLRPSGLQTAPNCPTRLADRGSRPAPGDRGSRQSGRAEGQPRQRRPVLSHSFNVGRWHRDLETRSSRSRDRCLPRHVLSAVHHHWVRRRVPGAHDPHRAVGRRVLRCCNTRPRA